MDELLKVIASEAEENFSYTSEIRRYFHKYPEIAKEEFNTAKRIEEELHSFGLETRRVGETGVYAEIKGEKAGDKVLVLRADIDALPVTEEHECEYKSTIPGRMHACGHDGHAASLLTAAKILVEHKADFGGTIRLCFQQGEEIGYGARVFINEGLVDGADRSFGIHAASNVEVGKVVLMPGPNNASVDWFKITVHGKAAHVSTPEQGIDALYIASAIVTGAQAISTRRVNPMEPVLIGIGKLEAGTAYNVVAQEASMEGTIRTMTAKTREETKKNLENLARQTAQVYGAEVSIEWADFTSPLSNDEVVTKDVIEFTNKILDSNKIITSRTPSLGGDDFAEFILRAPGTYAYIGTGNKEIPETCVAHHNSHFDMDERGLTIGAKLYAGYAIYYLG